MVDTKKTKQGIVEYDMKGEVKGEAEAKATMFGLKTAPSLLAQYVRVFQTNQRQGTASSKTRAEINGTTKKIYKQKGTGKARHGSKKAPIFKGGGIVGGPKPKEYRLYMNKKQKKLALFGSLTRKFETGDILCLGAGPKDMKTKLFAEFLKKTKLDGQKVLFVIPKNEDEKMVLALRNLAKVTYISTTSLNAYVVLNAAKIVFVGSALNELETHFLRNHEN